MTASPMMALPLVHSLPNRAEPILPDRSTRLGNNTCGVSRVDALLMLAADRNASDLHLRTDQHPILHTDGQIELLEDQARVVGGRVPAREILFKHAGRRQSDSRGKDLPDSIVMQTSRRDGMTTLNDAVMDLVETGTILAAEAYSHAMDKPGLLTALRRHGADMSFLDLDGAPTAGAPLGQPAGAPLAQPGGTRR
jgi:hypothetical protein